MTNNPGERKYSKYHEWAKVEGKTVTLGITDYAQKRLGDISFVELPDEGDNIVAETPFGSIESVKSVSDLVAPLNGKVVATNETVSDSPDAINSDPYGAGWLIEIESEDLTGLEKMMSAEQYEAFLKELKEEH